ncbi:MULTISPECIES: glycosyltransferase family 4 protein [Sphingobacterium]|jgi:glycosyltransferase involved in cell wall biosynthesis|uniref:glycosyltransferase family 4 protein n=1 Tax=Sphingobacterium TaxID=28453 RepID=UPI002580B598|nr:MULTISPECIES: glycosyltransferase family 4 protein [Sphingobacterium]MDF2849925.1 putative glycosyltransferase [Sphingobacterium multivorum]
MKILYYLPSLYTSGGLERIIVFKANYFANHLPDAQVILVTSEQRNKPSFFPLSQNVKHIDLNVCIDYPFDQSSLLKLFRFPFLYRKFKNRFLKILEQEMPDIVISTIRREINFLPLLKDGSIKVAELHVTKDFYHPNFPKGMNRLLRERKDRVRLKKLKLMDAVVFLTAQEKSFWPELSNVHVIPNPLVLRPKDVSTCQAKQVIAVGRYVPQKGFDLLIEAWSIVNACYPDWVLKIYGDGNPVELQDQIDRLSLTESCKLKPSTTMIEEKYCDSSIFVLSSRYEGFGMVLVEAMACGLPSIAFDCPSGPSEIIRDGIDGFLVENGNVKEMAKRICSLIKDDLLRKEMGERAQRNSARFHMENIAAQWKDLFESFGKNTKGD